MYKGAHEIKFLDVVAVYGVFLVMFYKVVKVIEGLLTDDVHVYVTSDAEVLVLAGSFQCDREIANL